MGQGANSGRNASLDNKKARAAGRQSNPSRRDGSDFDTLQVGQGQTLGAFGDGTSRPANRRGSNLSKGGGGGGGGASGPSS